MTHIRIAVLIMFLVVLPSVEARQTHLILLDTSGSMRSRYENGLKEWLVRPLLTNSTFQPGDHVLVRGFDKRGDHNFIKDDPQRYYNGLLDIEKILSTLPPSERIDGARTSIPEALDLGLVDLNSYGLSESALIYLITDNIQDESGSGDDPIAPFYEKIYNDPRFKNIYFFPIVREGDAGALVMYVLNYTTGQGLANFPEKMDVLGRAIGQRAVLFRPIRLTSLEIDRSSLVIEGEDGLATVPDFEDGRIVFTVDAGRSISGRIRFRLKSRFKEWKIEAASVTDATVELVQSPYLVTGDRLRWSLDPKTIELDPQQTTRQLYTIDLSSGGTVETYRPGFIESFFIEPVSTVNGMVSFRIDEPVLKLAFFDDPELASKIRRVQGLEQIEQFLLPRSLPPSGRVLELQIPVLIKIRQPVKPVWMIFLALGLVSICLLAIGVLLAKPKAFKLDMAGESRVVRLRPFAAVRLDVKGEEIGRLTRTLSGFKLSLHAPFLAENGTHRSRIADTDNFAISNSEDNRVYNFSIEPFDEPKIVEE